MGLEQFAQYALGGVGKRALLDCSRMSKKYKGKLCVYCAKDQSTTADHVIAREFFPSNRDALPKVPSCRRCNNEKAELEHYLITVLAFGARHSDALLNLTTVTPRRLRKNARLHRELSTGMAQNTWSVQYPGTIAQPMTTLPFDHTRLEQYFALVAKGLAWHHWGLLLGSGYASIAAIFSDRGAGFADHLFAWKARDRVTATLGGNAFSYEGLQGADDERLTLWRFAIYGGVLFGRDPILRGADRSGDRPRFVDPEASGNYSEPRFVKDFARLADWGSLTLGHPRRGGPACLDKILVVTRNGRFWFRVEREMRS